MPESTTCAECGRIVWVKDVDADGLCCFCAPEAKEKPAQKAATESKSQSDRTSGTIDRDAEAVEQLA